MSAEENMALARRFLEARVAKRDLDAVGEMLATDFVNHNRLLPGQEPDREGYLRAVSAYHAAFSPGHSRAATLARTMSSMPWPPRSGRLAQRATGDGRSRGWLGGAAPAFREARGPGGRA
jgi:hypothetical protein